MSGEANEEEGDDIEYLKWRWSDTTMVLQRHIHIKTKEKNGEIKKEKRNKMNEKKRMKKKVI